MRATTLFFDASNSTESRIEIALLHVTIGAPE